MQEIVRVVVVDDQDIVRDGLVTVLSLQEGIEVVGEARDGTEAVELVGRLDPDVVLMDLRMPGMGGAEATAALAASGARAGVLVLTTFADDADVAGALRAGARGYLTKDADRRQLADAVRSIASGQAVYAAEVASRLVRGLSARQAPPPAPEPPSASTDAPSGRPPGGSVGARFPQLTAREAEVLALVAEGLGNREIAARLFLGVSTVKSHINAIFAKLGVRTRAQAIALVLS
ncbi:response regulator [Brachybacterium sp. DNPG3]